MLLTCPACDTQYKVEDDSVAPGGSRVRCYRCSYTWTAKPPSGPAKAAVQDESESAKIPEPEASAAKAGAAPSTETPSTPAGNQAAAEAVKTSRPAPSVQVQAEDDIRKKISHVKAVKEVPVWPFYLLVLVLTGVLGFMLWYARAELSRAHPVLADLYRVAGYESLQPGEGLTITDIRSTRRVLGPDRTLIVEGDIVNVTSVIRPLPVLRIRLLSADGEELVRWDRELGAQALAAGGSLSFSFSFEDPPENAADVGIDFLDPPKQ